MINICTCGNTDLERNLVTHSNGTKHIKVICNKCGRCLGFASRLDNEKFTMPPGTKYEGKTIIEIVKIDKSYAVWASENFRSNNIKVRFREALKTV